MTRPKRRWWQKKTNWAIALGLINNLLPVAVVVPGVGLPAVTVINILAGAFGVYSIADRAGKDNEEV